MAQCGTKYDSVAAVYEVTPDRQNSHKWLEPARGVKTILRKFLQYLALFKSHLCLSTKFTHGQFGAVLPINASMACVKVKYFKEVKAP